MLLQWQRVVTICFSALCSIKCKGVSGWVFSLFCCWAEPRRFTSLSCCLYYAFHISCHFVTWAWSTWMRFYLHWGWLHLPRFTPSLYLGFNFFRTWPDNLWVVHLVVNSWTVLGPRIHLHLLMLDAGLQILIIKWESWSCYFKNQDHVSYMVVHLDS